MIITIISIIIIATIGERPSGDFGATGYSERTHFPRRLFLFHCSHLSSGVAFPPHGGAEGGLLLHRRGERGEGRRKSADTAPHAPTSPHYVLLMRLSMLMRRKKGTPPRRNDFLKCSVAIMRFSAELTRTRSISYYREEV